MFPMGLGFSGAALATAFCPVVTMLVCSTHYLSKKCNIGFKWKRLSLRHLISCCQLGVSAFVGEISSAVITFIFNMLILGLTGSTGVAAYGVVANMSLVGMAIMNGMSQGAQPPFRSKNTTLRSMGILPLSAYCLYYNRLYKEIQYFHIFSRQ